MTTGGGGSMPSADLNVNGTRRQVAFEPEQSLLSVLRDELDLTGAKYGCGEGQCGACTVLVDGRPTRSCVTKAASVTGKTITTVEGLEENGKLHPVQQAFLDADAMQCGYCTAGMIVESVALLRRDADPTEAEIGKALEGHVCRCCTYSRILHAVGEAARASKSRGGSK